MQPWPLDAWTATHNTIRLLMGMAELMTMTTTTIAKIDC